MGLRIRTTSSTLSRQRHRAESFDVSDLDISMLASGYRSDSCQGAHSTAQLIQERCRDDLRHRLRGLRDRLQLEPQPPIDSTKQCQQLLQEIERRGREGIAPEPSHPRPEQTNSKVQSALANESMPDALRKLLTLLR